MHLNESRFKTQRPATELVVVAGETKLVDLVDAKRKGFVSKVFVHPDYRTTKDGVIADLAILKVIIFHVSYLTVEILIH